MGWTKNDRPPCASCGALMIPQSVWKTVPMAERKEMVADGWANQGKGDMCMRCHRQQQAKLKRMDAVASEA